MREFAKVRSFIYTASIPDEQPSNLLEKLTLDEARDGQGQIAMKAEKLNDASRLKRWYGEGSWVKMRHTKRSCEGMIVVHYFRNIDTGHMVEFKFKQRLPNPTDSAEHSLSV
jgi:hypothetical protein